MVVTYYPDGYGYCEHDWKQFYGYYSHATTRFITDSRCSRCNITKREYKTISEIASINFDEEDNSPGLSRLWKQVNSK